MSPSTRTQLVRFLLQRVNGGWTYEDVAFMTDERIKDLACERLTNVDEDIADLRAAGLWPLPGWMAGRGIRLHGEDAMAEIIARSNRAAQTTYA